MMNYKTLWLFFFVLFSGFASAQREFATTEGDTTYTMKRYVFMLLMAGENTQQDSLEAITIQKGHMAHLNKMSADGQLVIAGPFQDGGKYRGLLVFDVETTDEAIRLESDDPAVKAGRLRMETFYWWAAKGTALP